MARLLAVVIARVAPGDRHLLPTKTMGLGKRCLGKDFVPAWVQAKCIASDWWERVWVSEICLTAQTVSKVSPDVGTALRVEFSWNDAGISLRLGSDFSFHGRRVSFSDLPPLTNPYMRCLYPERRFDHAVAAARANPNEVTSHISKPCSPP